MMNIKINFGTIILAIYGDKVLLEQLDGEAMEVNQNKIDEFLQEFYRLNF